MLCAPLMTIRLPHPLVLLLAGVAIAATLTWLIPAGRYQRHADTSGHEVVIPGTYAPVAATPVGPMATLMAVPRGIEASADVMVTVLLVGGAFALLEQTGALARLVGTLIGSTRKPRLVVAIVSLAFITLGALDNAQEELIALIPVLLVLSRGLGFGAVTALAMSGGAAMVGSAFGPTNPFQTGLALRFAEMPAMSQPVLRFSLLAAATAVWILWTVAMVSRDDVRPDAMVSVDKASVRDAVLLATVVLPFVPYVFGVLRYDWGFNELSALFLVAGFIVGIVEGRGLSGTAAGLLKGMEPLVAPAVFIGVARAISIVLADGQVLDTILFSLARPLAHLPGVSAVALMVPIHGILHVPVPSVSGQAVLTMPIMAPLATLLGRSRDAAVIAYQTGAGLGDMLAPTNGALLAMLLVAGIDYGRWLRFAVPGALLVALVGLTGIVLAG